MNSFKYTIAICDYPTLSDNGKRCLDSINTVFPASRAEIIYLSGNSSHATKLNMAIKACRTNFLCFLDNDTEFTKDNVDIFDKLDDFWEQHIEDAGSICFGHLDPYGISDESPKTPYINFYFTCYNTLVGAEFDENFNHSQCLDVAFQRLIRYLGWNNYGAIWMNPLHHHTDKNGNEEYNSYVSLNQKKMTDMFLCPTDGLPEEYNGWGPFELYLYKKYGEILPFVRRD
jgi:hypothetical protein